MSAILFLILFILFFAVALISVAFGTIINIFRGVKNTFSNAASGMRSGGSKKKKEKKKIFAQTDGKYVDFEEIKDPNPISETRTDDTGGGSQMKPESQISDAKFEDL